MKKAAADTAMLIKTIMYLTIPKARTTLHMIQLENIQGNNS
jgi:hypothetical protein